MAQTEETATVKFDKQEEEEEEAELRPDESEEFRKEAGRTLTQLEASTCLTCVGQTFRYINHEKSYVYPAYAYIAIQINGRNISDIGVLPLFIHVVYVDLTNNRLTDSSLEPLKKMKQLKALILDKNQIESAASVPELKSLQLLSVKENILTMCEISELKGLLYLDLSFNNICSIMPYLWCPYILPNLTELSMRRNGLVKLAGFLFSNLVSLFLGENQITQIEGLELLPNLKFLHLRNNPLKKLNGFSSENKNLFYLNIRDCKIENWNELEKLKVLPRLRRIVVIGNPFWDTENSRLRLIGMLPGLMRINKKIIEDTERHEAEAFTYAPDFGESKESDVETDEK